MVLQVVLIISPNGPSQGLGLTCSQSHGRNTLDRAWAAKPGRKSSICYPHPRAGGSQGGFRKALPAS